MFPLVDDKSCLGMGYYRSSCIRCPYGYTEELTSLFSQMGRGIIPVEVPLAALAKQPGSSWGLGTKFRGYFLFPKLYDSRNILYCHLLFISLQRETVL